MPKFRKKPVVIEAMRFHVDNGGHPKEFYEFIGGASWKWAEDDSGHILLTTLEGEMRVRYDDWIIKGVAGEFYPCKPDIFEKTYEDAGEDTGYLCEACGEPLGYWLCDTCQVNKDEEWLQGQRKAEHDGKAKV